MLDRQKLAAYAKKNSGPSSAASLLKKKREEAMALAGNEGGATTGAAATIDNKLGMADPTTPAAPMTNEPMMINDLVFEAEDAAVNGSDSELEDAIASAPMEFSKAPPWAQDQERWQEAAEAVGLDVPGIEEKFEEPFVVAAYLYKMLGGPVVAPGVPAAPGAEQLEETEGSLENPALKKPPMHGPPGEAKVQELAPSALKGKFNGAKFGKMKAQPLTEESEDGGENVDVATIAQKAKESPDPELAEKLKTYDPERDGNPAAWVADEALWEKAKQAVMPKWDDYDEPYAVVAHVYKSMGGTVK